MSSLVVAAEGVGGEQPEIVEFEGVRDAQEPEPVDRETLAEAMPGPLLGQVKELSGVDDSNGGGKGSCRDDAKKRLQGEKSAGSGCDLATGGPPDFLEHLEGELFGVVAFPFRDGQLGCDPKPAVVLIEAPCVAGPLPLGEGGGCDRNQFRPFEFDLPDHPAFGVDLEVEPGPFLVPVAAHPCGHPAMMPGQTRRATPPCLMAER